MDGNWLDCCTCDGREIEDTPSCRSYVVNAPSWLLKLRHGADPRSTILFELWNSPITELLITEHSIRQWKVVSNSPGRVIATKETALESSIQIVQDFISFVNEATFVHGLSLGGARTVAAQMAAMPLEPLNPDPMVSVGHGNPNDPGTVIVAQLRKSEVVKKSQLGGPVDLILGQQWIVYVFGAWEGEFRPRLSVVHGCEERELQYPILGDLRHLRNDVLHHRGIASLEHSGKCVILKESFPVGSPILMTHEILVNILGNIPFTQLQTGPT